LLLAALLAGTACSDHRTPLEPPAQPGPAGVAPAGEGSAARARHERFARRLALALRDPDFRASLFQALQQSRWREGKVHVQGLLRAAGGNRLKRLAELAGEREDAVSADLDDAEPLELYLPVPAHRRAWVGGSDLLVATAEDDDDVPVAFDPAGNRTLLDRLRPPATPVLAIGRAELSFDQPGPAGTIVPDDDPGGITGESGGTTSGTVPAGLYMTYAHVNSTFESWLKGAPEFEVHILGQDGTTGAMKTYQCAGESAGAPYQYNQDELDWRGSVMLFSQAQLDAYKAEHPGQALKVLVLEDDDTRCVIKTDSARIAKLFSQILTTYGTLVGGRDTLISVRTFRKAQSLFKLLTLTWSLFQSQDDIVGTAIEDSVAGEYSSGANWIIKGDNTVTYGALKLEMH
ncbi:MAG TPA: hypothetical protein VL241_08420, partial [Gemmatimonadales bacterium]|nr:hypothetical protein [Gemmatimonadales bacterium]